MRSVAIVGLGWLGLPLARHLKNLGWDVKGTKRTHEGVEQMRLMRLEAYHLELTPEINADPDDVSALLNVDSLIINIPPSQYFLISISTSKAYKIWLTKPYYMALVILFLLAPLLFFLIFPLILTSLLLHNRIAILVEHWLKSKTD